MREPVRLGVLATHPIQYHAPLYRSLVAAGVELTVFFAERPTAAEQGAQFGVVFQWDVDLTSGYRHVWMRAEDARGGEVGEPAAAIRRGEFDAFLVMGWHARAYWEAILACWSAGTPVLVRGDSHLVNDASAVKRLGKRLVYPLFMRRFAVCLSVGERSEEYFHYYGAQRVVRSPHFVDNAYFAQRAAELAPERHRLRERWGLAPDAVVFLFAGKVTPGKRVGDLISAVGQCHDRRVAALVVGDGAIRGECEVAARTLGGRVAFAGFLNQSEMPAAYAAADVLVLPSESETWGLVVNEGMASGRPALVSEAVGCAPDLISEGETGCTFPVGDTRALAVLLRRFAADSALLERMSKSARERISGFSVDDASSGVLQGIRVAMGRPQ